jgi:hypothetical protein
MWITSTFPVHGTLTILPFDGYCNRIEPARSAAVYPQKLQQNAMIIGSKFSLIFFSRLKITLQQAAVRLRRIPRKEFNQSIIRSLPPQQAAGNALAISVQNFRSFFSPDSSALQCFTIPVKHLISKLEYRLFL